MREASIHIKESDLSKILQEVFENVEPIGNWENLAKILLIRAKKYSIASRLIIVSNDKLLRKTDKLKLAGRNETGIFAQVLLLNRRLLHHRGLKMAEPGSQEWLDIKEACKLATEFCNEFGIGLKVGYNEYIKIGLSKIKNFTPYKFRGIHSAICKTYEAQLDLAKDKTPDETERMFKEYLKHINEKVGYISEAIKNVPEKYVCFLYAKLEANNMGLELGTYITAQFVGFEWANAIPDVVQLYGDKAKERAIKYCYENSIRLGASMKKVINFKQIKKK